jgi:carboxymethylenebutenolidase
MLISSEEMVPTPNGKMQTYLVRPAGEGPYPGVLLYHNIRGLTDDLRWCARRIAEAGYYCAAPDLYYRLGEKIILDTETSDADAVAIKKTAYASVLRPFQAMDDTAALIEFMSSDLAVAPGPMGAVGHCMGGYFAPLAAGRFPDRIRGAASINPIQLMNDAPDNPRRFMDQMQGELYFGFAELDKSTPLPMVQEYTQLLRDLCKADWRAEIHVGQKHGFAVPGRPGIWSKPGAELVFARTFAMFDRQLRGGSSPLSSDRILDGLAHSVHSRAEHPPVR